MGRREEMLLLRSKLLAEHSDRATAGEFAPLMGEYEQDYWEWKLDLLAEELEPHLPPSSVDEGNPDR